MFEIRLFHPGLQPHHLIVAWNPWSQKSEARRNGYKYIYIYLYIYMDSQRLAVLELLPRVWESCASTSHCSPIANCWTSYCMFMQESLLWCQNMSKMTKMTKPFLCLILCRSSGMSLDSPFPMAGQKGGLDQAKHVSLITGILSQMAPMGLSCKIRTLCMPADVNTGDVLLPSKGRIEPVWFLCIAQILNDLEPSPQFEGNSDCFTG